MGNMALAPAARSSLAVAPWFQRAAAQSRVVLTPTKLQRLLYFAQARFAAEAGGARLMPAVFLATAFGPLEPNIHHLFEQGPPAARRRPR